LLRTLGGERAYRYVAEVLLPSLGRCTGDRAPTPASISKNLQSGYKSLAVIYGHYAFARRGKDRLQLSHTALEALRKTASEDDFVQFLSLSDASSLWEAFVRVAQEQGHKPMEQLNRGAVAGMAELAQEIFEIDGNGSIFAWIAKGIRQTGRIEPQFMRMVDVRGVGPKLTSLILRDVVFLAGLEDALDPADRIYIQPIDKWIRLLAPYVVDEPDADEMADWILAGKIAKYTRRAGVSGIRFNMGATYFGLREVRVPENLERCIVRLLEEEGDGT
jgi:hypothetical protein